MTKHKASAEQWAQVEGESCHSPRCSCLMELRARVEALEAKPVPQGPTDERITSIAKAVQECARAWAPNARLLGNVRAEDIDDLCNAVLTRWGRPAVEPVPGQET